MFDAPPTFELIAVRTQDMAHRTITALYDTRAEAEAAHQRLREVGVPESAVMVEDASRAEADREHLAALPDEDRHAYEEGTRARS